MFLENQVLNEASKGAWLKRPNFGQFICLTVGRSCEDKRAFYLILQSLKEKIIKSLSKIRVETTSIYNVIKK